MLVFFIIVMLGVASIPEAAFSEEASQLRLNVGFKYWNLSHQIKGLLARHMAKKILEARQIDMATYSVPSKYIERFSQALLATGIVAFVERDSMSSIPPGETPVMASVTPNDPGYTDQWGPQCIGAESAWDVPSLSGRPEVFVAVIDTGIDLDHPDLELQVDTSIDYDFVNNDDNAMDDNGHGTHCAGVIAGTINNFIGIAGLQNVTLMAVKGLNRWGNGWNSVLANSIIYAVDNGAKVISNSWGGYSSSQAIAQATLYAHGKGAVVIAAAGNDSTNNKFYPAAYPWVVGVGALETCSTRAVYSNYGAKNVMITAPGSDILSTYLDDDYSYLSGTSMACPHVAGVAAMWISAYLDYAELTPKQVIYLLAGTADDLGDPGNDIYYGYGRVAMYPWSE
jgi:subtilisin family serine protease